MRNILLFSDKLKQLGAFLKFHFIRSKKWSSILFKRRKKLEKISFDYYRNWYFNNAYLVIDFRFKNMIWFKIGKFKSFDFSKPIILNLENITTDTINFEVFGFFQKQLYEINLNKEAEMNTIAFKTKIDNIGFDLTQQKTRTQIPKIGLHISNPIFDFKEILIVPKNLQLNYNPFKIQDYL